MVFLSSFRGKRDIFRNFTPEIGKKYMKKLVYLALIAFAFAACSTPGQKAEALIKDYLQMSLLKPETYKPVKTILREANSPYDDIELLKELMN